MNVDPDGAYVAEVSEIQATFYVGLAGFTVLIWDHMLTFSEEVEYIWKGKKGPLVYLFFLNRYITPLGFCVNLIAYFSNYFTPETFVYALALTPLATSTDMYVHRCQHFVRFEGAMTVIGINIAALMMLLRIYAIYKGRKPVVAFVALLFLLELGTNAWLLTHGIAVRHTHGIHTCTMIFDRTKVHGGLASASAWLPLVYETVILGLTLLRTYEYTKKASASRIMGVLAKEGILYFSVIFTITFILTLMIPFAPDGLQNVTAQMEYLMTVAMMSRITLHLKKQMRGKDSRGLLLFSSTVTSESRGLTGSTRSRFRFSGAAKDADAVNVTMQHTWEVHDDRGDIVETPRSTPTPTPTPTSPTSTAGHSTKRWRERGHEFGTINLYDHNPRASHGIAEWADMMRRLYA